MDHYPAARQNRPTHLLLHPAKSNATDTYYSQISASPGFTWRGLWTESLLLPPANNAGPAAARYSQNLLARLRASFPGTGFALANELPLADSRLSGVSVSLSPSGEGGILARRRFQSSGYFRVLGIRWLAGQRSPASNSASPFLPIVVSRSLSLALWGSRNPLGQHLYFDGNRGATVSGVVADVRDASLDQPPPLIIYLPIGAAPALAALTLVARAPAATARQLQAETGGGPVTSYAAIAGRSVLAPRVHFLLLGLFGLCTLLLAFFSVAGLALALTSRRRREFAVRLALGASPRSIAGLVVREVLLLAAAAIPAGLLLALFIRRWLAYLLAPLQGAHPSADLAAALIVLAAMLCAALWPAIGAAQTDPAVALSDP